MPSPAPPPSRLTVLGREHAVEVLESLVRTYLVYPLDDGDRSELARLPSGAEVALAIGAEPPVVCTLAAVDRGTLRLIRGRVRARQ